MHRRGFLGAVSASAASASLHAGQPQPPKANRDVAARARRLHEGSVVVVIHDHNPIAPDVPRMLAGGVTAKVVQIGVDVEIGKDFRASAGRRDGWRKRADAVLDEAQKTVAADSKRLLIAVTAADIRRAKNEGKIAILFGVEGGKLLEGDVAALKHFYNRGLRELQLRWAVPNQLVEKNELTDFGRAVVRECDRLGVIVDLTHIPEPAFFQALQVSEKPVIVSHGTGRELGGKRLEALADHRGVVGLHFYTSYLGARPTVLQVVEAIDYLVRNAGADTIGLGIDFFPTTGPWRDFQAAQGTTDPSWAIPDMSHMEEVTRALVARNYTDAQIRGILGENFLRVCREVLGR